MTVQTSTDRILEFDLVGMDDASRASWLAVYELGCRDGWTRGYQAAEDDMSALWRQAHAVVQQAARQPTLDELQTVRERRLQAHLDGERQVGA